MRKNVRNRKYYCHC